MSTAKVTPDFRGPLKKCPLKCVRTSGDLRKTPDNFFTYLEIEQPLLRCDGEFFAGFYTVNEC